MNSPAFTYKILEAKDPTRTLTLRSKFTADMKRRFNVLRKAILKAIIIEDVFGLKEDNRIQLLEEVNTPGKKVWEYRNDAEKVKEFRKWLKQQIKNGVLEFAPNPVTGEIEPWTNRYIQSAYQKGILQARQDLIAEGVKLPTASGISGTLSAGFNQPIHISRMEEIFTRVFTDLEGVTEVMDRQMSRILSLGLAEGKSPYEIGKLLGERVKKIGITRGTLIARTEVIRSYNIAAINEYRITEEAIGEEILVQWWTALDERVRSSHASRHGKIYRKEEAEALLGEPNCRCSLLPIILSIHEKEIKEAKKEGIRGRRQIAKMKKK